VIVKNLNNFYLTRQKALYLQK